MNWYSLRVMSGKENKVKDTIFRELDFEKDLKTNVEEILIPTENIVDIKNGKKTVKEKSLLPGYILVKMVMSNEIKFFIENVDGVMSFVGPKGSPQPVTEAEMSRYLVSAESDEFSSEEIDEIPFKVGDSVKVIDGPFKEFNGLVQEVNDRNRIKVNVFWFNFRKLWFWISSDFRIDFFSRTTKVGLDQQSWNFKVFFDFFCLILKYL